jgi:hypothetical protein
MGMLEKIGSRIQFDLFGPFAGFAYRPVDESQKQVPTANFSQNLTS